MGQHSKPRHSSKKEVDVTPVDAYGIQETHDSGSDSSVKTNGNKKSGGCVRVAIVIMVVLAILAIVGALVISVPSFNQDAATKDTGIDSSSDPRQGEALKSGTLIYDGPDAKVTYRGIEEATGVEGAMVSFEVENKTDKDALVGTDVYTSQVNGYNVQFLGGNGVNAHGKAIVSFVLGYKQFDAENVGQVKSITFDMVFYDSQSLTTTIVSIPISLAL